MLARPPREGGAPAARGRVGKAQGPQSWGGAQMPGAVRGAAAGQTEGPGPKGE